MSWAASKAVVMGLGVARCAPDVVSQLELPAVAIRSFLLADVLADLFQFESNR